MNYISTRNKSIKTTAAGAISQGISVEGGLFVPDTFPTFTENDFEKLFATPHFSSIEELITSEKN